MILTASHPVHLSSPVEIDQEHLVPPKKTRGIPSDVFYNDNFYQTGTSRGAITTPGVLGIVPTIQQRTVGAGTLYRYPHQPAGHLGFHTIFFDILQDYQLNPGDKRGRHERGVRAGSSVSACDSVHLGSASVSARYSLNPVG